MRKIVQIAVVPDEHPITAYIPQLVALCDDGSVWQRQPAAVNQAPKWYRIPTDQITSESAG